MICLHIDIHNPDGFYASTERWYYDNAQDIPNRKQLLEDYFCQHMTECGYIIGNIYTTNEIKNNLEYCLETDKRLEETA